MKTYQRCNRHDNRPELPRGCSTCLRIDLEKDIVTKTVDALLADGFTLHLEHAEVTTTDRATILAELMEVDDEHLVAFKRTKSSWVRFVYGNDGWDVISDYTIDLEDVLKPVNDWAMAQS